MDNLAHSEKKKIKILVIEDSTKKSRQKESQFEQAFKEITGLAFPDFFAVLAESTTALADVYGLFGREDYLEKGELLAFICNSLSAKAKLLS